jgi:hypothetical protein
MRLGPAALKAGGLLKELLQVGAQEVLQRFKLGVRDVQIAIQSDQFEQQLVNDGLSLVSRWIMEAGWFGHACCLPDSTERGICKMVTFLT